MNLRPERLLPYAAGVLVLGLILTVSLERRESNEHRAPFRMLISPAMTTVCEDLARLASGPSAPEVSSVSESLAGVVPFGLEDVDEVTVVIPPDPSLVTGYAQIVEDRPSAPLGESTVVVQVARWPDPLERLVEALDGEVVHESTEDGHLVDVAVQVGEVTRIGTNCQRDGWFVYSTTQVAPPDQPPCTASPAVAAACERAWAVAAPALTLADRDARALEVRDGTAVVTTRYTFDGPIGPAAGDLVSALDMDAWHEAPSCPDRGDGFGPSPICSDPFFVDAPDGPFTWTFDRADAVHVDAAFTPAGDVGYDLLLTVTARPQ